MRGNIWTVSVSDGMLTQLTFLSGWARNPPWDFEFPRMLAFVTHDGQFNGQPRTARENLAGGRNGGRKSAGNQRLICAMRKGMKKNTIYRKSGIATILLLAFFMLPQLKSSAASPEASQPAAVMAATPVFRFPVVPGAVISGYFDHNTQAGQVTFYNGRKNLSSSHGFYFSCSSPSMYDFVGCENAVSGEASCPNNRELWYDGHKGVDYEYSANWHTGATCDPARFSGITMKVYAPAAGKVMFAGYDAARPANGWHIRIKHDLNKNGNYEDDNFRSNYLHFTANQLKVSTNDIVTEGQELGLGGSTGYIFFAAPTFRSAEIERQFSNFGMVGRSIRLVGGRERPLALPEHDPAE